MGKGKVEPIGDDSLKKPFIESNRKCRDIVFLFIFIIYWVGMIIVACNAISNGDPQRLVKPQDYLGNFCGYDNSETTGPEYGNQTTSPYLYYFDLLLLNQGMYTCVESCPDVTKLMTFDDYLCAYNTTPTAETYVGLVSHGLCAAYVIKSEPVLNRCIPIEAIPLDFASSAENVTDNSIEGILASGSNLAMQAAADLSITWPLLIGGAVISMIVTMFWMYLLQWFAGIFVWLVIIIANVVFIVGATWLYFYWQIKLAIINNTTYELVGNQVFDQVASLAGLNQGYATSYQVNALMYAFYTVAILAGLLLLITIALFKRILIAVAVLRQASSAMMKMKAIVFFPISMLIFILVNIAYFLFILAYMVTPVSAPSIKFATAEWQDPNMYNYMLGYHTFGFIWTFFFLSGINQMTIAGAIASWYWTMDKKQKFRYPVMKSLSRVCRFHLGSIAVGSLLIAIVEFIRILVYQIQKKVQKSGNQQLKYLLACIQCCLKIVSILVKFINKNAYIYIAISGMPFFKAAGEATSLLMRNALRAVAVDFVSDFILLLSKLVVGGIMGLLTFFYLDQFALSQIGVVKQPVVTVVLVVIEALIVAGAFFSVYEMAVDTIFLSFLHDLEKNDGTPERPFYMTEGLKKVLGVENKTKKGKKVHVEPDQI